MRAERAERALQLAEQQQATVPQTQTTKSSSQQPVYPQVQAQQPNTYTAAQVQAILLQQKNQMLMLQSINNTSGFFPQ